MVSGAHSCDVMRVTHEHPAPSARRILRERVQVEMNRAKRDGEARRSAARGGAAGVPETVAAVRTELEAGRISRSEAARRLDCGYATVLRLIQSKTDTCALTGKSA